MRPPQLLLSTLVSFAAVTDLYAQAEAGNLVIDSENHGNDTYGDWAGTNFLWGAGYPLVDVAVDTDESLIFPGGVQRQGMFDMYVASGGPQLDNPAFTDTYSGDLFPSGLICDSGTMQITYTLAYASRLVDIMLLDLDESDIAQIEIFDAAGQPASPDNLVLVSEGDLSLYANAPGQPSTQLASPPHWDPTNGVLTAAVTWNENRSFSIFRPQIPISEVRISATGIRSAPDANSAGSHIYTAVWATPRVLGITDVRTASSSEIEITWTSLPGLHYQILGTSNHVAWSEETIVDGFPPPATHSTVTLPIRQSSRFFRIGYEPTTNTLQQASSVQNEVIDKTGAASPAGEAVHHRVGELD